jgi:hypothetical protein
MHHMSTSFGKRLVLVSCAMAIGLGPSMQSAIADCCKKTQSTSYNPTGSGCTGAFAITNCYGVATGGNNAWTGLMTTCPCIKTYLNNASQHSFVSGSCTSPPPGLQLIVPGTQTCCYADPAHITSVVMSNSSCNECGTATCSQTPGGPGVE